MSPDAKQGGHPWLLRIAEIFADKAEDITTDLEPLTHTRLGREYHLLNLRKPGQGLNTPFAPLIRWNMPVQHAWPCNPRSMDHFVERAAGGITNTFSAASPQALRVGQLDPGSRDPAFKTLARNLRGRLLQLLPTFPARTDIDSQDPDQPTLFCLLGKQGLFAGIQSPRLSHGFHPGGTKFIRRDAQTNISRAGAKIAEALHHMPLYHPVPPAGARWLELGASPGGMSSELLRRDYAVTAIDRATMDPKLHQHPGLQIISKDVSTYQPPAGSRFDALLCDMNGPVEQSFRQVIRLSTWLQPHSPIVFTLKGHGTTLPQELVSLAKRVESLAKHAGLQLLATRHLSYNRWELTLFLTNGESAK